MTVSGPEKVLYLTLGILFLALGVVGLIIPILPGVLFLAGALYMLSRGSSRIRLYAERHPRLRGFQARVNRLDAVPLVKRCQVMGLMAINSLIEGARKLTQGAGRLFA